MSLEKVRSLEYYVKEFALDPGSKGRQQGFSHAN